MEKAELIALVARARSGDRAAMEEVLRAAHTSVSYQCRKLLRDPRDAEDMTQEVLLTVYTRLDTLKTPEAFWGWLNQITAHRCVNAMKRSRVELQFAEDEEGHSVLDSLEELDEQQVPDRALDNAETTRMIEEIVDGLPDAQRVCTMMYYYDEMSVKEIASALGVSENTVKSRLNYARKAVKERVLDYEKKGVKLYGLSPLPFMLFFLLHAAEETADSAMAAAVAAQVMEAGAAAAGAGGAAGAAGGAAVGGSSAAGGAAAAGGLSAKLIAGALAGLLLLGGAGAAVVIASQNAEKPEPAASEVVTEPPGEMTEPAGETTEEPETPSVENKDPLAPDPRWAELQPGETAVQYYDIFVKSGMTVGEVVEAVERSAVYQEQPIIWSSYHADLDEEFTVSAPGQVIAYTSDGSITVAEQVQSTYTSSLTIQRDSIPIMVVYYFTALPGREGTTYRLRDLPVFLVTADLIHDYSIDEVRTFIGSIGDIWNMGSQDFDELFDTAFPARDPDVDLKVTDGHYRIYDVVSYLPFSWNGYSIRSCQDDGVPMEGFPVYSSFALLSDSDQLKGTWILDGRMPTKGYWWVADNAG